MSDDYIVKTSTLLKSKPLSTLFLLRNKSGYTIPNNVQLFINDKLLDFKNQTLTSATFDYIPYVIEKINSENNQSSFSGFEPLIIKTIANSLNANLIMNNPVNGFQWQGTVTDVVGLNCSTDFNSCDGEVDFGFGNMYDL